MASVLYGARKGLKHIVLGKPHKTMFDEVQLSLNFDPKRTLFIGDRLETDIMFGVNGGTSAGALVRFVLVLISRYRYRRPSLLMLCEIGLTMLLSTGIDTMLVLTGASKAHDLAGLPTEHEPTFVAESVGAMSSGME